MKFSLQEVVGPSIAKALPWDLEIEIRGKAHRVREITLADLMEMERGHTKVSVIAGYFEKPRPDLREIGSDELLGIMAIISAYVRDRVAKNSQAIVAAAEAAMARKQTSGS